MKNFRTIQVKFLPPTNSRGARMKITESRFNKTDSKVLSYDYSFTDGVDQVIKYLESIGIEIAGKGTFKNETKEFNKSIIKPKFL